ncbi:hypothetical protein AB0C70_22970 [Streptomyces sp. NPDC048564]|uniref:hypothetical protein n=1 Tax=Streptomyces sp. NPDC048564 TaxID=3155760 RepID=UPI0034228D85
MEMFGAGQVVLAEGRPLEYLPEKSGEKASKEIGGRCALRYLRRHQVGVYSGGTTDPQWVTLTPYTPKEAVRWLALPNPLDPPGFVLFIDIASVPIVKGPGRVRLGGGIEYLLPGGFPAEAVVHPKWEVEIQ